MSGDKTYQVLLERTFQQTFKARHCADEAEARAVAREASFSECSEPDSDSIVILDVWEENE